MKALMQKLYEIDLFKFMFMQEYQMICSFSIFD